MSKWEIPWECKNYLYNYQGKIRGYLLADLLDETTFREKKWLSNLGPSGMTLHPNNVFLDDRVTDSNNYGFISCVIAHELAHVAQQLDWGHVRFMLQYGWEALCCMFRYERMKLKSIEKEAFDFEKQFGLHIGYYSLYSQFGDLEFNDSRTRLNLLRVAQAVDVQLKSKFVKRGNFKSTSTRV